MENNLGYVTISLKNIQPSTESRCLAILIEDSELGKNVFLQIFLTGNAPTNFVKTEFSDGFKTGSFANQANVISSQNEKSLKSSNIVKLNGRLSDGKSEKGVCVSNISTYKVVKLGNKVIDGCDSVNNIPQPMPSEFSGSIQPDLGVQFKSSTQPSVTPMFSLGDPGLPPTITAPQPTTPSIGNLPPGTKRVPIATITPKNKIAIGYQIPGGPKPIGLKWGASEKKGGGFPYWFYLGVRNGRHEFYKSKKAILEVGKKYTDNSTDKQRETAIVAAKKTAELEQKGTPVPTVDITSGGPTSSPAVMESPSLPTDPFGGIPSTNVISGQKPSSDLNFGGGNFNFDAPSSRPQPDAFGTASNPFDVNQSNQLSNSVNNNLTTFSLSSRPTQPPSLDSLGLTTPAPLQATSGPSAFNLDPLTSGNLGSNPFTVSPFAGNSEFGTIKTTGDLEFDSDDYSSDDEDSENF